MPNSTTNSNTFSLPAIVLAFVAAMPFAYLVYINLLATTPVAIPETGAESTSTPVAADGMQLAVETAKTAAEKAPSYKTYLNLGLVYYQAKQYELSIEATQKAIDFDPNQAVAYNNIAAAYGALEKWDFEIAACEKALQLDPNFQLAKNNLAWAKSQKAKADSLMRSR